MNNKNPSVEEQEIVRKYVLERPLYRPGITYKKAFAYVILGMLLSIGIAMGVNSFLRMLGFFIKDLFFYLSFFLFEGVITARYLAIMLIRLYQHYAPEEVRRRCLLKPTCSEYGIIVIKKYGAVIGALKIWNRLNKKCCGRVYYIDEP